MRNVWRLFFEAEGASPWITTLCLLCANLVQGIGFVSLLPLLAVATEGDSSSPLFETVRNAFATIGLPLTIGPLVFFAVTATVVSSALRLLATRYVGYAEAEVATRLRLKVIRLLIATRWSYYLGQPAGRINHALMGLTTTTGTAYANAARFIAVLVETAIFTVVALVISFKVALVGLAVGLGVARILNWFVRRSRKAGKKGTVQQRQLGVLWGNTLSSMKPLKAMARHTELFKMLEEKAVQWRNTSRKQVVNKEARSSIQEMLLALLLGIGCYLALVIWSVPVVELIVVGVVLSRAVKGVGKIQGQYQLVAANEYPYLELQEFIREIREEAEPDPGTRTALLDHRCALENVTFSYGRGPVLDAVTVEVRVGEITVLTGPSGAGKTTILDLLLGLHRPQAGAVTVDGVSLNEIAMDSWRKQVGYVPQELVLFHDTILANIQLGDATISRQAVENALRTAGAWDFIEKLPQGVMTVVGMGGSRLSGGQRQRIALARAIVTDPRLLVLDEVTSALDPEAERVLCTNVKRLAKDKAILAITHRPAFLDIADTVYEVIDGGAKEVPVPNGAGERMAADTRSPAAKPLGVEGGSP